MRSRSWRCWPPSLVIAPLVAIFVYLIYKGASSLNLDFFTKIPKPPGEVGGGMANAIVGSAVLLGLASVIGIPIGIGGGIYLAEFGRGTKLANAIRFTADVLNGVPSIVMGVAAYALIVSPHISFLPVHGALLGVRGRSGAGHHDDSHHHPHHRRDAAHGAQRDPRSRAGPGSAQLALRSLHHR